MTQTSKFFNTIHQFTILAIAIAASFSIFAASHVAFAAEPQAPNSSVSTNTSRNWSGYVAKGSTYTGVSGSWTVPTVPTVTPTNTQSADVTWVGIGGASTSDLIQAGTEELVQNGQVTYQAWYELLPSSSAIVPLSVHPGDNMSASIEEQGSTNTWTITITDHTTNQVYTTNVSYTSSLSSAEWIEEMPSNQSDNFIPLDNFGNVPFTNAQATVNSMNENLVSLGAYPVTMTSGSQVLASPSAIGSDDESFTVTRGSTNTSTPTAFGSNGNGQHVTQWQWTQPQQASTTTYRLSPGQTVHFTKYVVIPAASSTAPGTTQTQTFTVGNSTVTVQFTF